MPKRVSGRWRYTGSRLNKLGRRASGAGFGGAGGLTTPRASSGTGGFRGGAGAPSPSPPSGTDSTTLTFFGTESRRPAATDGSGDTFAVAFGAPAFGFPPEPEASAAAEGLDDRAETEASELAEVFRGAEEAVPPEAEDSAAADGLDDLAETEASELAEVFRGAEEVVPPEAEDSALATEDLSGSGGAIGC